MSLSRSVPQSGHATVYGSSFSLLFFCITARTQLLYEKVFPTLTMVLSNHSALYSNLVTNSDQEASVMDLGRL
ncbi:hypothetical protein SAMN05444392_1131 [Seinonella peptonophila]|uniref:Uncharacterized protein n=1 Tax=Seinonella peptonophila TaxID=112248 RepID=A0A1M5ABI7_9BACL|nr:hypothetical protein SAMN05444392_1131 [Seinonella peptonophila]